LRNKVPKLSWNFIIGYKQKEGIGHHPHCLEDQNQL